MVGHDRCQHGCILKKKEKKQKKRKKKRNKKKKRLISVGAVSENRKMSINLITKIKYLEN